MFTKKQVQDMIEKDLRKQILVPLLQAMKFQGVHEYHGNTEFGKDIICWKFDELNNRKNLALVVKAAPVSGQSKVAADIENQVRQCFSKPYVDPITGSSEEVDRCWVGQKEATLTNDGQPIPIRMQLVLHFDGKVSGFHMNLDHDVPLNVHQKLTQMRLLCCVSKPHTVHFTNLETGIFAGYSRSEVGVCDTPDENALEALAALDALQIKSRRLVSLPDRELTVEEYQDINMLRALFRTGKLGATWNNSSASIIVTDEDRGEIGQTLSRLAEEGGFVYLQQDEILSLFGEAYALGPIKLLSLPAKLVNWLEVKTRLDQGFCGELRLKFVPSDDGSFTKEYVKWLPENDGALAVSLLPDANESSD